MNAWTIYWVMQLDRIGTLAFSLALISSVTIGVLVLFGAYEKSSSDLYPELDSSKRERARGETLHRVAKRLVVPSLLFAAISAFIPSSRTAATMAILPAIANNEQIKKEAGDLYGLAKQALSNLAKHEEKSK